MEFNIEVDGTGRKSRGRISLSVPRGHGTSSGKPDAAPKPPGRIKIGKDHHSRIVALKVRALKDVSLGRSCPWTPDGDIFGEGFWEIYDMSLNIKHLLCVYGAVGGRKSANFSQKPSREYNIGGEWLDMWYVAMLVPI